MRVWKSQMNVGLNIVVSALVMYIIFYYMGSSVFHTQWHVSSVVVYLSALRKVFLTNLSPYSAWRADLWASSSS
jgi:hypothetical protein